MEDLVRDDQSYMKDQKCLKSIFLTVKKPAKMFKRVKTMKNRSQNKSQSSSVKIKKISEKE